MKKDKKLVLAAFLLLAFVLLVASCLIITIMSLRVPNASQSDYLNSSSTTQSSRASSSLPVDETAGWTTYVNAASDYSIKYPADKIENYECGRGMPYYTSKAGPQSLDICLTLKDDGSFGGYNIMIQEPRVITKEQYDAEVAGAYSKSGNPYYACGALSDYTIDGVKWDLTTINFPCTESEDKRKYFQKFFYWDPKTSEFYTVWVNDYLERPHKDLFERVLSTLDYAVL